MESRKKMKSVSVICTLIFISFPIKGQDIITFDNMGWNSNQLLSTSFSVNNYTFSSNEAFYTNYGYNFNVNSVSLYYVFQNASTDKIAITTLNNNPVTLVSLAAYQVSQSSTDSLVIEGWKDSTLKYTRSFIQDTTWLTYTLNYKDINKIVIRLDSAGNGGLADFNFDNIVVNDTALPVEITTFKAISQTNGINLEWQTATEINNYGFDIEKNTDNAGWIKIGFIKGAGSSNSTKNYYFFDTSISQGKQYLYRLKQIDNSGEFTYSNEIEVIVPVTVFTESLSQNYPNPFNPITTIQYTIPKSEQVVIKIYDIVGREVKTLVNEYKTEGKYNVIFNGSNLASGVYFYTLNAGNFKEIRKLMLLK